MAAPIWTGKLPRLASPTGDQIVSPMAQPQSQAGQKISRGAKDDTSTARPPSTNRVPNNSASGFQGIRSMIQRASQAQKSPSRKPMEIRGASAALSPLAAHSPAQISATAPVVTPT